MMFSFPLSSIDYYCFSYLASVALQQIFFPFPFPFPFGTVGVWEIIRAGDCFHTYMDVELKKCFHISFELFEEE